MPNLSELMKGRVEELVKGPKPVPIADYPGVIKKHEVVEFQTKNGPSAKLRIWAGLTGWPESVREADKEGIGDILNRQVPCDYWLPVGRAFALLCQQCGLSGEITEQTPYQLVGKPVLVCVQHQPGKDTIWAVADKLIGTS